MCTASWFHEAGGYHLFFNRDELRTRLPARAPAVRGTPGRSFIAPADGDFGGSWISVNAFGVSLALLNGYVAADGRTDRDYESRGNLVTRLSDANSIAASRSRLESIDLSGFRSFRLLVLSPSDACLADWHDESLEFVGRDEIPMPLISSSFATDAVCRSRLEQSRVLGGWRTADDRIETHLGFHAGHLPERGAYSVCMHRPNAHTVSFSWIRVRPERVRFHYTPHAPHAGIDRGAALELGREPADDQ